MTSVLPEEESNVTRLKQKSQLHGTHNRGSLNNKCQQRALSSHDESRSFLTFSRENLSISTSDLEQGFGTKSSSRSSPRPCRGFSRQTLLSLAALLLALSCAGLELWKLRLVLANARDIETVKRDVEQLKHRFLEKDLLDELRAFEEQLYGEGLSEEDDDLSSNPSSNNNSDYDSSYDDSAAAAPAITTSGDYPTAVTLAPNQPNAVSSAGSSSAKVSLKSSINFNPLNTPSTGASTPTTTKPCTSKNLEEVLAVLRRAEAERGQAFEQSVREQRRLAGEHLQGRRRRSAGDDAASRRRRDAPVMSETWSERGFFTRLKHPSKK